MARKQCAIEETSGRQGERLAQLYLEHRGYRIIDINVRLGKKSGVRGELDIVAWDGPVLCFIEVKTRRASSREGSPAAAVSSAKQRQLTRLATGYAIKHGFYGDDETPLRFDVVAIVLSPGHGAARIQLLQGAFLAFEEGPG